MTGLRESEKKIKKRKKEELRKKYRIKVKGFKVAIEELKQIISAKSEARNIVKTNFSDATKKQCIKI